MLSSLPVQVEVGKGKLAEAVVVRVVFGGVVDLAVVDLAVVLVVGLGVVLVVVLGVVLGVVLAVVLAVVLGVLEVLVVAGYVHCEHEARTVWLLGEQTSNGT